jgi:asparagine synthase (glutamine-hydrolysing)
MCGIAGVFRTGEPAQDRGVVASMLEPLEPRGPDGEGMESEGGVTLGHRRLAILDLSAAGRQPMRSASGRFLIGFNGEIYNFRELQEEMGLRPGDLRSQCDTEVLLAAWERWGEGCLDHLVGQFAFAVHDREEQRLWLARDRLGEKPLFYHHAGGTLAFASSLASLLRAPWVPRELDEEALAEYLTLRYVVSPRTLLGGVVKLPPGHLLRLDGGGLFLRRWWSPAFRYGSEPLSKRGRVALVEEFGALLSQACRRCLVSDVPVALLISDGIDSHSVLASLTEAGEEVPAFFFQPVRDRASAPTSHAVERRDGGRTEVLTCYTGQSVQEIEPALSSFTEPIGDGAALATWHLIHNGRSRATVFVCGHGADELLGGYRLSQERFRLAALHRLCRLPGPWLDRVVERYTYGEGSVAERRRALVEPPPNAVPAAIRYLIHRPLPPEELAALFGDRPPPGPYLASVDRLYREAGGEEDHPADLDLMQEVLMRTFLSENILTYADSMAMDSSAELRLPYLDRDLLEFVLRLPPAMRVSRWPGHTNTKRILRWWARDHVPREVVRAKKRTFNFGRVRWMMEQHGEDLRSRILDFGPLRERLPGLETWISRPPATFRGPWEGTLWALLALAVWGRAAGLGEG